MNKKLLILGLVLALVITLPTAVSAQNVDKVILASTENYPDAIVSSAVSQKLGVPVLLTEKDRVPEETMNTLEEFNASNVIVVGGPAVISEEVITTLETEGYQVTRLWGMTRYGTATEISGHFWPEGANEALLVQNKLGEEKGNILGAAKNLANGKPIFPIPEGKIPARVLNQLRKIETKRVGIVATNITEGMESNLSDLNITIEERIQAQDKERLQERIQNKTREKLQSNETLVVVATAGFRHVISAPNLPQSKSFLVSSEEGISDAVEAVNERNIQKVKVVGKPDLAEIIAEELENKTDAEVELTVGEASEAVKMAANLSRINRNEFSQRFHERHHEWTQRIEERQKEIKERANKSIQKAEQLIEDYNATKYQERLQAAKDNLERGNNYRAIVGARKIITALRKERWQEMKNNWTAMHKEIQQEVQSLRQRTRELAQINKEFGETMRQNMTTEERLETIKEFRERRQEKVREIVGKAEQIGRGPQQSIGKWIGEVEESGGEGTVGRNRNGE